MHQFIKRKRYADYRRKGKWAEGYGVFPLVLWIVPDENRKEWMRKTILKAIAQKCPHLYAVVTMNKFPQIFTENDFYKEAMVRPGEK